MVILYTSHQKVNMRYEIILEVLKILTKQGDQTAKALGLLQEVSTFRFIIILQAMETILMRVHSLSCELQSPTLILPSAMELVNSTKQILINMRTDNTFEELQQKAELIAKKNYIQIEKDQIAKRRKETYNTHFDDYFIESTVGKNSSKQKDLKNIKAEILFEVLDRFLCTHYKYTTIYC